MGQILIRLAKQWIAGEDRISAIARARRSNERGMGTILNNLGEDATERSDVESTVGEYLNLLQDIKREGINARISLKPTQLGLSINSKYCLENMRRIVSEAKTSGIFVWVDMESSKHTEVTIDIYLKLREIHERTGLCIQCYLMRSKGDLDRILNAGGRIRLVKGAYNEPKEISFKSRDVINGKFIELMEDLFKSGVWFAIATHDNILIEKALGLNKQYHGDFEFQFLLGVREELKSKLVANGHQVSEYIPYGKNWLPYCIRRVKEKKSNVLIAARSLVDES
jgi:proline dehydrogenase